MTVWNIAKWPVMLLAVVLVVAILYYATPNVGSRSSAGSASAPCSRSWWIVASAAFGFYVANFASTTRPTARSPASSCSCSGSGSPTSALLFGAELDAELERGRELLAGLPAEETIQPPPRDTRKIEKAEEKEREDVERGRELRLQHESTDDHAATPRRSRTERR